MLQKPEYASAAMSQSAPRLYPHPVSNIAGNNEEDMTLQKLYKSLRGPIYL